MTVLHLISNRVLPFPGGMQESVMRIGGSLAEIGFRVVVYTLHQPADYRFADPSHDGLTVVHLDDRDLLVEPYLGDGQRDLLTAERRRSTALALGNAIDRRRAEDPEAGHVVVSFYASGTGFIAQMVAARLGIPHVAAVRGTDFELDVFGPNQANLRVAVEGARQVVTTNRAQAAALAAIFSIHRPIRTIHNALPRAAVRPLWTPPPTGTIRLISDCGFSGRKGTHLLLRAAADLLDRGRPISLILLGGTFWLESTEYWDECRRSYDTRYPGRFSFPGHVGHDELEVWLRGAHIYCSASLAEGSSIGRIRALTLGIPMVTTANGEIADVVSDCPHVWLCQAGDWKALASALDAAAAAIRAGTLQTDVPAVERWRAHFRVDRERDEWRSAIEAALAPEDGRA